MSKIRIMYLSTSLALKYYICDPLPPTPSVWKNQMKISGLDQNDRNFTLESSDNATIVKNFAARAVADFVQGRCRLFTAGMKIQRPNSRF